MSILVTGGAGYIGSHILVELASAGYDFIVYDNLWNGSKTAIQRVAKISKEAVVFEQGDIRDTQRLKAVFEKYTIEGVIHLAGLKAVGESVKDPLSYYDNNVVGTLKLLEVMQEFGCKTIVFSSSATVYGEPQELPIKETHSLGEVTNPYGRSKLMIEQILKDLYQSDNAFKIAILRYFNPIGSHESGLIGEDPKGMPNNLMPYIAQVAMGKRDTLSIFGADYETKDGTGIRDYIHVVDLAKGHIKALEYLEQQKGESPLVVNLGTGQGYSVFEVLQAFEKASNKKIEYTITARRAGDIAQCFADPRYAKKLLNWEATKGLDAMCEDTWRWQSMNPSGYEGENIEKNDSITTNERVF